MGTDLGRERTGRCTQVVIQTGPATAAMRVQVLAKAATKADPHHKQDPFLATSGPLAITQTTDAEMQVAATTPSPAPTATTGMPRCPQTTCHLTSVALPTPASPQTPGNLSQPSPAYPASNAQATPRIVEVRRPKPATETSDQADMAEQPPQKTDHQLPEYHRQAIVLVWATMGENQAFLHPTDQIQGTKFNQKLTTL